MSSKFLRSIFSSIFSDKLKDEIFLIDESNQYTYGDVANLVLKLSEVLKQKKAKFILIDSANCPTSFIIAYACMFSNKIYIPVTDFKEARIEFNEINSFQEDELDSISIIEAENIFKRNESIIYNKSITRFELNTEEQNIYVLRTSGTTRNKKLFIINSNELETFCVSALEFFDFNNGQIFLNLFELHFDFSVFNLLIPVSIEGKVYFPKNKNEAKLPIKILSQKKIDILALTPSHADLFQKVLNSSKKYSLSNLIFCGEMLKRENVEFWKKVSNAKIFNAYGPAECTVFVSAIRVDNLNYVSSFPIGKPFKGTEFEIVDDELFIMGKQVSRSGYINYSNEKFSIRNDLRCFQSGDIAEKDNEGNFYIRGRCDFNIKISSKWINLNEVEFVVNQSPKVLQVVAISNETFSAYELYVSINKKFKNLSKDTIMSEIHLLINQHFSIGFLPKKTHFIDEIPLNSSLKADRNYLKSLKAM